jgi:uncharacterized short protein YbdD (DUF466 family)
VRRALVEWMGRLWRGLRQASGDSAYELYLERVRPGARLSREEFWLDTLRRRYSGPSRCC